MSVRLGAFVLAAFAGAGASLAGVPFYDVDLIAAEGQTVQGADGMLITSLNSPFTNGLGQVGFTGGLANPAGGTINFVFADDKIIWRNDEAIGVTITGAEGTMGIGDNGEFVYSPSVDGDDAAWSHLGLLLKDGDLAPGLGGMGAGFNSRPTMTPDGTAYWVGGLDATPDGASVGRALWRNVGGPGGAYSVVLQTGDLVGGLAIDTSGIGFDYQFSDNNDNYIIELTFDTSTATDTAIVVNGSIVAREGSATGGGDNWSAFDSVSINNAGNYLFTGDTSGPTATDEFIAYNGSIALREGDSVAGVTLGSAVNAVSINNLNQASFIWSLSSTSDEGLFWADDASDLSAALLLLRTGDEIDTDGDSVADAAITDFNASNIIGPGLSLSEHPWVYVEVDLVDLVGLGEEYEAILRVRVPAPGGAAALGLLGLAGLRRRR